MWPTRCCSALPALEILHAIDHSPGAAQKYDPLTFIFDLGGSYETLTRVFGGTYLNVGLKNPGFTINPFSLDPTHENLNFLYLFLRVLIEVRRTVRA